MVLNSTNANDMDKSISLVFFYRTTYMQEVMPGATGAQLVSIPIQGG